jgi:Uma2 family endonuclease
MGGESVNIEEMKRRKYELGLTSEMIAERSGVPLSTVQKIFAGITTNPRLETRLKIERVLLKESADRYFYSTDDSGASVVRESNLAKLYGKVETINNLLEVQNDSKAGEKAGPYTIEDYIRASADRRVELINGYLYDLASPTSRHQIVVSLIMKSLLDHSERNGYECMPYQSPLNVRLNRDNKTMLQPDLFVICKNDAVDNGRYIEGAPDFVIEVLSPSTAVRDMKDKLNAYFEAGVREYWVIDPDMFIIDVFSYENAEMFKRYTFEDQVPVGISGGGLSIDFRPIRAIIEKRQEV